MATRKIKDAKDLTTNELIYFKGHAKATYMSDGRTVEDAINNINIEAGPQGPQGEQGPKGEDGVGIASVAQTTTSSADGGSNVVTVTLSDGKTSTFSVKNGSKGSQGEKGDKGDKGDTGTAGANGTNGTNGKDGANGATFTPSVDADGNLSWTNNGGLSNPPTVNIKGPKGDSGEGGSGGGKEIVPVEVSSGSIILNEYRNIPFEPNKIYYAAAKVTENLSIQWVIPPTSDVAEYSLHFSIDSAFEAFTMDVPAEWQWVNGKVPEVNPYEDASYELSVVATKVNGSFVYKAVLTKFA